MWTRLKELFRYRQLIAALVSRELKSRYRGTVLGFLWSFINPLLLMLVYTIVFGLIIQPRDPHFGGSKAFYALFLFTGILPWSWFAASVLESARVLFAHGDLIKKIRFPVESLPIMVVLANMVHFLLGLPILALFFVILGKGLTFWVFFFPVGVLVQLIFTMGLCFLVSALTVHFRDLQDILANLLTLWFFSTPIIYPFTFAPIRGSSLLKTVLALNPMTYIIGTYQLSFYYGSFDYIHWKRLVITVLVGLLFFYIGYLIFNRLRDTFIEEV